MAAPAGRLRAPQRNTCGYITVTFRVTFWFTSQACRRKSNLFAVYSMKYNSLVCKTNLKHVLMRSNLFGSSSSSGSFFSTSAWLVVVGIRAVPPVGQRRLEQSSNLSSANEACESILSGRPRAIECVASRVIILISLLQLNWHVQL